MNPSLLCPSLLKWLSTFEGCGHVTTARDIDSGVIVARVLHQIEPACFSADWLERINTDVGDNWRLKVRNLKKVAQSIVDYFSDNLELSIGLLKQPELTRLAEQGNVEEATRLIQLVLGVAINCSRKQEFIEAIRLLEPGVQTALMTAIQELMTSTLSTAAAGGGSGQLDSCSSWLGEVSRLTQELQLVRDERDTLSQRCFQQERQLQELHDEKMATAGELQSLQARAVKAAALPPSAPTEPVCDTQLPSSGDRYKQLRVKLDAAQDEIYRLETSRDELKSKFEERDRQLKESQSRLDELQKLAEESRTIKDELDILRERSIKVSQYESTLETYKRRLQEMHDLRAQIKTLELKNAEYVQLNEELEEEVKKSGCYRPQLDIYKQRVTELLEQLTEETGKLDVAEFERRKLTDRLDTIQLERDRVVEDRERLKETIEELRLSQLAQQQASSSTTTTTAAATTAAGQGAGEGSGLTQPSTLDALPHVSPEIRDRLLKLQHENRLLRLRAAGPSDVHETAIDSAYRQLASDFNQREATHLADIRSAGVTSSCADSCSCWCFSGHGAAAAAACVSARQLLLSRVVWLTNDKSPADSLLTGCCRSAACGATPTGGATTTADCCHCSVANSSVGVLPDARHVCHNFVRHNNHNHIHTESYSSNSYPLYPVSHSVHSHSHNLCHSHQLPHSQCQCCQMDAAPPRHAALTRHSSLRHSVVRHTGSGHHAPLARSRSLRTDAATAGRFRFAAHPAVGQAPGATGSGPWRQAGRAGSGGGMCSGRGDAVDERCEGQPVLPTPAPVAPQPPPPPPAVVTAAASSAGGGGGGGGRQFKIGPAGREDCTRLSCSSASSSCSVDEAVCLCSQSSVGAEDSLHGSLASLLPHSPLPPLGGSTVGGSCTRRYTSAPGGGGGGRLARQERWPAPQRRLMAPSSTLDSGVWTLCSTPSTGEASEQAAVLKEPGASDLEDGPDSDSSGAGPDSGVQQRGGPLLRCWKMRRSKSRSKTRPGVKQPPSAALTAVGVTLALCVP